MPPKRQKSNQNGNEFYETGAFDIEDDPNSGFNLKPKEDIEKIPEDQEALSLGVYETWGVLKTLDQQGLFRRTRASSDQEENDISLKANEIQEYKQRLLQIAEVGLKNKIVHTTLAAKALDQCRGEICIRIGQAIKLEYLIRLAIAALPICAIALGLIIIPGISDYYGFNSKEILIIYGSVILGSMAGAWMSVASTRSNIEFRELTTFLGFKFEPFIRMIFVALIAITLVFALKSSLIPIQIGNFNFQSFFDQSDGKFTRAILLGIIAGISEKVISLRIIDQARRFFIGDNIKEDGK